MSMIKDNGFDERQILARGNGFRWGYLLTLMLGILNSSFDSSVLKITAYSRTMVLIWTSVAFVSIFFILKDAYDGINSKGGKSLMIATVAMGLIDIVVSVIQLCTGNKTFFEDGLLGDSFGQMYFGFCVILIGCVYFAKQAFNKKNFPEDDSK